MSLNRKLENPKEKYLGKDLSEDPDRYINITPRELVGDRWRHQSDKQDLQKKLIKAGYTWEQVGHLLISELRDLVEELEEAH